MTYIKARLFNAVTDLLSNNNRVIENTLKAELEFRNNSSILDLGCGTGRFSRNFTQVNYAGIDLSKDYVSYANRRYGNRFSRMDARRLEFPDGSFDNVLSVGLLHHLSDDDSNKVLAEANRVLRPEGTFCVIDAIWPTNRVNIPGTILRRLDRGKHVRTQDQYLSMFRNYFTVNKSYTKPYGLFLEFAFFCLRNRP